jgi:dsRNA-specific ribonuclease
MGKGSRTESELNQAWVGDAVLTLHARLRILRENGRIDAARSTLMTSNQFLSSLGEPTAVEAAIGRVYQERGLEAAFAWIDERVGPVFARQEENRARREGKKREKPA